MLLLSPPPALLLLYGCTVLANRGVSSNPGGQWVRSRSQISGIIGGRTSVAHFSAPGALKAFFGKGANIFPWKPTLTVFCLQFFRSTRRNCSNHSSDQLAKLSRSDWSDVSRARDGSVGKYQLDCYVRLSVIRGTVHWYCAWFSRYCIRFQVPVCQVSGTKYSRTVCSSGVIAAGLYGGSLVANVLYRLRRSIIARGRYP